MQNKRNRKILIAIICFICLSILMFIMYNIFKTLNNQLLNDFLIRELNVLSNSEDSPKFVRAMLYYDLGMASKYIGFCSLGITVILSGVMIYKDLKATKQ